MTGSAQQVLDIGDVVEPGGDHITFFGAPDAVVVALTDPSGACLVRTGLGAELPSNQVCLSRVGGPLQPGDWVRVTGTCQTIVGKQRVPIEDEVGLIVDTYRELEGRDFLVSVRGLADLYECRAAQLTRITRAEALP